MKMRWSERVRYLALYVVPALVLALIVGGANILSYRALTHELQASSEVLRQEFGRIAGAVQLGSELAHLQESVRDTLTQATAGRLDRDTIAATRAALAERLAVLERQLLALDSGRDDALLHGQAVAGLRAYRQHVLVAFDRALVEPGAALAHGHGAHEAYTRLSVDIHDLVAVVAINASEQTVVLDEQRAERVVLNLSLETGVLFALVALWLVFAFGFTRHVRAISVAMQRVAGGDAEPPELAEVRQLGLRPAGLLRSLAQAVLSFRDTLIEQRDNEALLRTVFEEAPYAIELVDAKTMRFVKANAASRRTLGRSEAEMSSLTVSDIQADLSVTELAAVQRDILDHGFAAFETKHRRADGELFDARVSVRVAELHGTTYLIGIWQDVSTEKAAQAEIRKLSLVVEQNPNAVIITDVDARIEYVNDAFVRKTGYAREEVLGQNPRLLKSGRTPEATYVEMWQTLMRGEAWSGEFTNLGKDGMVQMERAIIAPLRGDDGSVTHYVAIKQDITEEKARTEERNRLFLAVEQSPDSIVITDLEARIEYVNRAFLSNTGYSREQVIGQNPRVLQSTMTPRATYEEMWRLLTRGESWRGELINRRRDGSVYVELAHISPVRQSDGRITHYVAIKQDITEKRRMQEELERHRDHLEQLVAERSSELIAAKEAAEIANRAKSEFLANMSHEIRTPMNAIIGFAHLLKRKVTGAREIGYLVRIDEAGHHLLQIINDILDLSKIEAGRLQLELADFEPVQIIEQTIGLVRDKADAKGLALIAELGALPAGLRGDALRFGQVLLNLLSNAVKFTDAGYVSLHAQVLSEADLRVVVRFEVRDSGIGLSDEQRMRLFQPFEQADRSTTRKYGGTGLGLAITRQLVELMGGRIGVESRLGAGSTFWFELPFDCAARADDSPAEARSESLLAAHAPGPRAWEGARILVAEDDPVNQELAVELLKAVGFAPDVVEDGQQAVQAAQRYPYDLILMDMQMPVMDGIAATRQIRSQGSGRTVPILAMTASAFDDDLRRCLAAGMSDRVVKPVEPARLYEAIQRWLPIRNAPIGHPATRQRHASPTGAAEGGFAAAERAPACEETDLRACLAGIAGLDVDTGLQYTGGLTELYLNLLRMYVDDRTADALSSAMKAGDLAGAQRAAHTLKSVTGALGAVDLRDRAAYVEGALANVLEAVGVAGDAGALQSQAVELAERAHQLQEEIQAALLRRTEGTAGAVPAPGVSVQAQDWREVFGVCAQLEELLVLGDLAVRDFVQAYRSVLTQVLAERLSRLESQIDAFDFDNALLTLRTTMDGRARKDADEAQG